MRRFIFVLLLSIIAGVICFAVLNGGNSVRSASQHPIGTVVFSEGHATDHRDGGRPVVLIAHGLNVKPDVFRQAFSGVNPAQGWGGPTHSQAKANKKVLMDALEQHGVTNERLDEVSNYYRYRPQSGDLWTHTPAKANAIIEDGKLVGFNIVEQGSGYSSQPRVEVAGYPDVIVKARIEFSRDLGTNGKVSELTIVAKPPSPLEPAALESQPH